MSTEANRHPSERKALAQVRRLATEGLGESTKAHGITLILGNAHELLKFEPNGNPSYGEIQNEIFDFRGKNKTLDDFKTLQAAAKEDGAIVIDRATRVVTCANYLVTNIGPGRRDHGGARDRAASAIAQLAGGCFVIKASEDACALGTAEKPDAQLDIFNKCKESVKVPVQPREDTSCRTVEERLAAMKKMHAAHMQQLSECVDNEEPGDIETEPREQSIHNLLKEARTLDEVTELMASEPAKLEECLAEIMKQLPRPYSIDCSEALTLGTRKTVELTFVCPLTSYEKVVKSNEWALWLTFTLALATNGFSVLTGDLVNASLGAAEAVERAYEAYRKGEQDHKAFRSMMTAPLLSLSQASKVVFSLELMNI